MNKTALKLITFGFWMLVPGLVAYLAVLSTGCAWWLMGLEWTDSALLISASAGLVLGVILSFFQLTRGAAQ